MFRFAVMLALAGILFPLAAFAQAPADLPALDQIADIACANDEAVLKWILGMLAVPAVASILANFRNRLPAWLVKAIDALALNFVKAAPKAAPVLLIGLVLALGACTSAQMQTAATDAQTTVKAIQAACAAAQQAEAAAKATLKGGALETTDKVGAYVDASCTTVDAITALAASPTSVAWLNGLTTTLSTTAQLAAAPPSAPVPAAAPAAASATP